MRGSAVRFVVASWSLGLGLVVASGCGSDDGSGTTAEGCTPGLTVQCQCSPGVNGSQACNQAGSYDACVCTGGPQPTTTATTTGPAPTGTTTATSTGTSPIDLIGQECAQGDTCQCMQGTGICVGPSGMASCTTAADCASGQLCALSPQGAGGNVCITNCVADPPCQTSACPTGFACGQFGVCTPDGAMVPLQCQSAADCSTLPGSTCIDSGIVGLICALPC